MQNPGLIVFLLMSVAVPRAYAEFNGWITEVYAKGGTTGDPADWMEIYCGEYGDVTGAKVYHMYTGTGSLVKTLPAITVEKGDFIIIHFSDATTADETDATGDTNGNGVWDLYTAHENSSSYGIYLSKGAFWITKIDGSTWEDFVVFADEDNSWNNDIAVIYAAATAASQWNPAQSGSWVEDDYRSNIVNTNGRDTGISMQRESGSSGDPLDTNTNEDWKMAATSEGDGYFIPQAIAGRLKVDNSPFFPNGDSGSQPALGSITYRLDSDNYNVTLAVYDVNGYVRRYLLHDYPVTAAQGGVTWNGYDESGGMVPVGIYIVHLRAEHRDSGKIKTAQDTIVVGRKF